MDEEIDLRRYVLGVLRHWPLIAALTLVAAATLLNLRQINTYEAVALVSVSAPRYILQPSGASANGPLPVRASPELAESGNVLAQVLTQSQSLLPGAKPASLAALQGQVSAEAASDPTLLRLKVHDTDPQRAADLANFQLYAGQLADAKNALATAESDLAAFQCTNQVKILTAQLNSQQDSLTDYWNRRHRLELLNRDADDLIDHLCALAASAPPSPVDNLALLAITGRIYGSGSIVTDTSQASSGLPVQVQLTAGQPLAGPTVADQLALASNLHDTIAARLADIDGQVAALEPHSLALQGQVAEAQVKEGELDQARVLADRQYRKLASQMQNATLVAQASSNTVQIPSRAVVPTVKIATHRATNVLLGAALGLVLGILMSLANEYWRSSPAVASH